MTTIGIIKKISTLRVSILLIFLLTNLAAVYAAADNRDGFKLKLSSLERNSHGRLGVYAINSKNNFVVSYRGNERFPMASTSKVMIVSAILSKNATKDSFLNKNLTYTVIDVRKSGYAPVTEKNISHGMTVKNLCAAAIQYSDSAASNLLVKMLGGPKEINRFARTIGDTHFHLDRLEPQLNTSIPGDERDTTTPAAMAKSLQKLAFGKTLSTRRRQWLQQWLKKNTTGDKRIRAGVPAGSVVGDKTGTGSYGSTSDVAIIWPKKSYANYFIYLFCTNAI